MSEDQSTTRAFSLTSTPLWIIQDEQRRAKNRERCKARYAANKEAERAKRRIYYQAHKEECKAQMKVWREANKPDVLAAKRAWREANREEIHARQKEYRAAKRDHLLGAMKDRHRLRKYNVTPERFVEMLAACNGRCPCCKTTFSNMLGERPCVDHAHDQGGKIRGLLCRNCNMMLGNAKDNPKILRAGARYLERMAKQA